MFILLYTREGLTYRHPLRPGDTVVGRAPICDLAIDEPSISRRHVRFRVHGEHCVLTDLGGRNGTFLNGEQVTEAEVKAGDAIVLGRFPLRLDHGAVESLVFSDSHALVQGAASIIRPASIGAIAVPDFRPEAPAGRLMKLVSELSRQLVAGGPLANLLERIATVALDLLPVDRAFVLLLDEHGTEVLNRVSRARNNRPVTNANLSRAIVRRVVQDQVAMLGCDATLETGRAGSDSLPENVRWFMCTPLSTQTGILGMLYVDNPNSAKLNAADLDVLQALGSYASAAIEQSRLTERMLEHWRLRDRLQRHHSTSVVEQILADISTGSGQATTADDRDITVLMIDIVGFTRRVKAMQPAAVAQLLNRYYAVASEAVFAEDGTVDRFEGDRLVAVFGAPLEQPDHAARALRVAQVIRHALTTQTGESLSVRIALNSGVAVAGEVGWTRRRDFAVVGDVVNTCERILSYVCEPGQIVFARGTRDRLGEQAPVKPLGPVHLRGRDQPIDVFVLDR